MNFKSKAEVKHNSKLLQIAMQPELIGLENIKKCRIEFPVFPNWPGIERIGEDLFLTNKYEFNGVEILVYNYDVFQKLGRGVSPLREQKMGKIDVVLQSDNETVAVEYKNKHSLNHSVVKRELTKAQKGLWKNYGITTEHLYYVFGDNFEYQELIGDIWVPFRRP